MIERGGAALDQQQRSPATFWTADDELQSFLKLLGPDLLAGLGRIVSKLQTAVICEAWPQQTYKASLSRMHPSSCQAASAMHAHGAAWP